MPSAMTRGHMFDIFHTVSAYLELSHRQRERAYQAITQVLPPKVEIAADIVVHLARRGPE